MATRAVTTTIAKKKMLLARAGKQPLAKISQMVFGSGGVGESGEILMPEEDQTALNNEIYRKDIEKVEIVSDTQIRYYCTLNENELANENISEIALADADGDLLTIKNFKEKGKDIDFKMTFKINDTM